MKKGFKFLEHTADAFIEADGRTLEEAFENAAAAMTDVMTELEKIKQTKKKKLDIQALDEKALLYNWLEELLLEFEINSMLYSKFDVVKIFQSPIGVSLSANVWGEEYDPKIHVSKVGIKAATYHEMKIIKAPNKVTLRFILDI